MPKVIIKREGWKCSKCGYEWIPKQGFDEDNPPFNCPNCNNARWNISNEDKEKKE